MANPTLYASLVAKVQAKRLQYANRLAVFASVALGLLISRGTGPLWWSFLVVLSCWAPLLLVLFLIVRLSRDRSTVTTYSEERTWSSYLTAIFFTRTFYLSIAYYSALALIVFAVSLSLSGPDATIPLSVVSKEYRVRNRINGDFIYYFLGAIHAAIVYTLTEFILSRNRLPTQPQIYRVVPQKALFVNLPRLLARSVALAVLVSLLFFVTYMFFCHSVGYSYFLAPLMLILGLDKPARFASFSVVVRTCAACFYTFLSWELFNHVYNVYASIGCLDGAKLISLYSPEPLATILSGQRFSSGGITKLTVFQELALVATTTDKELLKTRLTIYNTKDPQQRSYWPQILDECLLVLREATARVTKREGVVHVQQRETQKLDIFGNSQGGEKDSTKETVSSEATIKKYVTPATKKSSFETVIEPVLSAFKRQVIQPLESVVESVVDSTVGLQMLTSKQAYAHAKKSWSTYSQEFLVSTLGAPFRTSLFLDSRARVDDPTTYGNAVVAVAGLLIHAVEEDRVGLVLNRNIAEVLTVLERLIRACGDYTENPPVYRGPGSLEVSRDHQVALLHDIAMQKFYDVCIKYNYKLNDLVLSQRAFKLAKLVIDAAIAQQRHG